jgi:hypothetical protein
LTFEGIVFPEFCPALGVAIDYTIGKGLCSTYSASFDRIDPTKGYVRGNVIIVSNLANAIKSNASVEQIERVAAFYRQMIPHAGEPNATSDTELAPVLMD